MQCDCPHRCIVTSCPASSWSPGGAGGIGPEGRSAGGGGHRGGGRAERGGQELGGGRGVDQGWLVTTQTPDDGEDRQGPPGADRTPRDTGEEYVHACTYTPTHTHTHTHTYMHIHLHT